MQILFLKNLQNVYTVDRIEWSTGYDFLSNVPVEIQAVIER